MLMIRLSQGRIFQTLVLFGACYVSYAMGAARRRGWHRPWIREIHYLLIAASLGVGIYFLRLSSALREIGVEISWDSVSNFGSRFAHFALERGNMPNFSVVFTIIDKIPTEVDFLYGKTLIQLGDFFHPEIDTQSGLPDLNLDQGHLVP
jgi:hypothetical protein